MEWCRARSAATSALSSAVGREDGAGEVLGGTDWERPSAALMTMAPLRRIFLGTDFEPILPPSRIDRDTTRTV